MRLPRRYADYNQHLLRTTRLPGCTLPVPQPGAEPDDFITPLLEVIPKIYHDCKTSIESCDGSLTQEAVNRIVWYVGGSDHLALAILRTQKHSLAYFRIFLSRNDASEERRLDYYPNHTGLWSEHTLLGECPICFDEVFPANNAALSCNHLVCFNCVADYVTDKINNGRIGPTSLVCPHEGCSWEYNPVHIYMVRGLDIEDNIFQKYIRFQVMTAFEMSPFARYCSNEGCSKLTIANSKHRRIICRQCGTHTCYKCKSKYHKLPFCRSTKKMNMKMRVYYMTHGTKQCPRCKFLIEKTAGCDHMNCGKCGHEFCWRCFRPYTPEHLETPFECSGVTGVDLDIWGPLAPLKALYELGKDSLLMVTVGGFMVAFTWPYLVYRASVRLGLKEFMENRWDDLKCVFRHTLVPVRYKLGKLIKRKRASDESLIMY